MIYTLIEALAAVLVLIPLFLLLNRTRFHSGKRTLLYFLFASYLAAVYHLTGLPTVPFLTFDVNLNLVPTALFTKELVLSLLNVAMFVPLGFFLPLLWKKYRRLKNTLLFGVGATVFIELAQLFTYRATDINDVITNTAGALLGYLLFLLAHKLRPVGIAPAKERGDLLLILAVTAAGMFFVQPLIAAFLYGIT